MMKPLPTNGNLVLLLLLLFSPRARLKAHQGHQVLRSIDSAKKNKGGGKLHLLKIFRLKHEKQSVKKRWTIFVGPQHRPTSGQRASCAKALQHGTRQNPQKPVLKTRRVCHGSAFSSIPQPPMFNNEVSERPFPQSRGSA